MPVPARRLSSGTIWVETTPADETGRTVVHARVCSHDQRQDLDRQVARLTDWARLNGHEIGEVVREVGPGLTGKRPQRWRVLSEASATVVVVEHRDRLARFGVEHLEAVLSAHGRTVVGDMIEVLISMCVRLYGCGGARDRAVRAVTATKQVATEPAATKQTDAEPGAV